MATPVLFHKVSKSIWRQVGKLSDLATRAWSQVGKLSNLAPSPSRQVGKLSLLLASFPLLGHDFRFLSWKSECLYFSTRIHSTKAFYQHGNTLFRLVSTEKHFSVRFSVLTSAEKSFRAALGRRTGVAKCPPQLIKRIE